jgi:hypothetical protein
MLANLGYEQAIIDRVFGYPDIMFQGDIMGKEKFPGTFDKAVGGKMLVLVVIHNSQVGVNAHFQYKVFK